METCTSVTSLFVNTQWEDGVVCEGGVVCEDGVVWEDGVVCEGVCGFVRIVTLHKAMKSVEPG